MAPRRRSPSKERSRSRGRSRERANRRRTRDHDREGRDRRATLTPASERATKSPEQEVSEVEVEEEGSESESTSSAQDAEIPEVSVVDVTKVPVENPPAGTTIPSDGDKDREPDLSKRRPKSPELPPRHGDDKKQKALEVATVPDRTRGKDNEKGNRHAKGKADPKGTRKGATHKGDKPDKSSKGSKGHKGDGHKSVKGDRPTSDGKGKAERKGEDEGRRCHMCKRYIKNGKAGWEQHTWCPTHQAGLLWKQLPDDSTMTWDECKEKGKARSDALWEKFGSKYKDQTDPEKEPKQKKRKKSRSPVIDRTRDPKDPSDRDPKDPHGGGPGFSKQDIMKAMQSMWGQTLRELRSF